MSFLETGPELESYRQGMRQKCYQEIHMEGGSGRQDLVEEMLSTVCLEASTNPKESLGAGMTLQSCLR